MQKPKQTKTKVVILGGGYAGTLAALRLASQTKGHPVEIVLINNDEYFVERIRLHQRLAGEPQQPLPFAKLLAGTSVQLLLGRCTAIDTADHTLTVQVDAGTQIVTYDQLVYALGSTVERSRIPGVAEHALSLASAATSQQGQAALAKLAVAGGQLLIVGGGLTGIEAATELAERYPKLQVTLVTSGKLGATLSTAGQRHLHRVFSRLGIAIIEETTVEQLTARTAQCSDGRSITFDQCLWAGAFSVPTLAREVALPVNETGRILVDETLRVIGQPAIYAVGDAAATGLRMACATAMPMGGYVADQLAAQLTRRPLPGAFRFGYGGQCISLGRKDGLLQFVYSDDRPRELIIGGRLAAWLKEQICCYTVQSLWRTKWWPQAYLWPKTMQVIAQDQPQIHIGQVKQAGKTIDHEQHYRPTPANL